MQTEPLELFCRACRKTTTLTAEDQQKIIANLRLPSARHVVDCGHCHMYQWALAVERVAA